ncbi:transposase [Patescibacteria group bacterium]
MDSLPNRKSIRLPDYDYSQSGMYYVTICVHGREYLFGNVVGATPGGCPRETNDNPICIIDLNFAGQMIERVWNEIKDRFPGVKLDKFIIMPNHVHGIIQIHETNGQPPGVAPTVTLPNIVHWFKTKTTNEYIRGIRCEIFPRFYERLWQRNYYEHIIRDDDDLNRIREYIQDNPKNWKQDDLHI